MIKRKTPRRNSRGSLQHDRTLGYRELNCAHCARSWLVIIGSSFCVALISDLLHNQPKKLPEIFYIKDFVIRYCAVIAFWPVCHSRVFLIVECPKLHQIASPRSLHLCGNRFRCYCSRNSNYEKYCIF